MAKTSRIKNTLEGREKPKGIAALMSPKMIMALVLIGIFSFAALMTLSGYAGDMRQKNNGQAHALSRSAIGFGGLARLLGDLDYDVRMVRAENVKADEENALRIYTMSRPFMADQMDDLAPVTPTLIIMPKWNVVQMQGKSSWVQKSYGRQTFGMTTHQNDLKELTGEVIFREHVSDDKSITYKVTSDVAEVWEQDGIKIDRLQTMDGAELVTIFEVEEGPVLVKLIGTDTFILSDPDFMNTMGIESRTRSKFAIDMIDAVIANAEADTMRVDFDLSFHGFGSQTNIIKVLTQPPFLAATLCLLAAGALIAWQAFSRFGDPVRVQRDYALGKFSLADNAARFIRIAGREPNMAKDYVALVRKQVIGALNLQGRRPKDINAILERRETSLELRQSYDDLRNRAGGTMDNPSLMQLAEDLENWKTTMISGETK